jgi:hypothetical protein
MNRSYIRKVVRKALEDQKKKEQDLTDNEIDAIASSLLTQAQKEELELRARERFGW